MPVCYIGLGSNLGERKEYIQKALDQIRQLTGTKVTKISTIIESEPQGGAPQGKFLNAAIEVLTELTPQKLLIELQNIEKDLGRLRSAKNGPRTIDLDILLFDSLNISDKDLTIPHPRMMERPFVLGPLGEIAPGIVKSLLNENN